MPRIARAFVVAALLFAGENLYSQEVEIRFATLAPQSSAWGRSLQKVVRQVFEDTGKTVKIKIFYGGQMGDESEMIDKIQYGQLEGGAFTGNGLGKLCPEVRVLEIPGLFQNGRQVDHVYAQIEGDLQGYFEKRKFALVTLAETGFAYFFSKKDIRSVEDIRKTKMWIWKGDKLVNIFMAKLGIPAIPVNFTEVTGSLQSGLIDGFYVTPTGGLSLQWTSEAKSMLNMPISDVTGGMVLSSAAWAKLNPSQRDILRKVSRKHMQALVAQNRQSDADALAVLQKQGLKINASADPADLMVRTGLAIEQELDKEGLAPTALVKKVRALAAEVK